MEVFLTHGFHAAPVEDLEEATGKAWQRLLEGFGDKESLFFAATEERLVRLTSGPASGQDAAALTAIETMLRGLRAASSNARLRVTHKAALQRLLEMAEASSEMSPADGQRAGKAQVTSGED